MPIKVLSCSADHVVFFYTDAAGESRQKVKVGHKVAN